VSTQTAFPIALDRKHWTSSISHRRFDLQLASPDGTSFANRLQCVPKQRTSTYVGIVFRLNLHERTCTSVARSPQPKQPNQNFLSGRLGVRSWGPNSPRVSARVYRLPDRPNSTKSGCNRVSIRCLLRRTSIVCSSVSKPLSSSSNISHCC
jgi:hypothetical protein